MLTQQMLPALLSSAMEANSKPNEAVLQAMKGNQEQALQNKRGQQEKDLQTQKSQQQSQAQAQTLQRLQDFFKNNQGTLPPGAGLSLGSDSASITRGYDPLAMMRFQASQNNLNDKNVQGIADRSQKEGIPQIQAQTDILNQDMQNSGGHLQSVGGLKNAIPDSLAPMAEYFGILPKGSAKERQDIAALRNAAQHATFGSRQTEAEKAMMGQQLGTSFGNSATNIESGIKGLGDVSNREAQNLMSGATPQAAQTFQQRGGDLQVGPLGQQQAPQQQQTQAPVDPMDAAISAALQKKANAALQKQTQQQQSPQTGMGQ
jgi:hypothetical protein